MSVDEWQKQSLGIIQTVVCLLSDDQCNLKVAHFVIPALDSNRPEHQSKGIEVFSRLYGIPIVRNAIEIWAKQHEKIRFGAFCRATIYHSRYLMDRFQKRRALQRKESSEASQQAPEQLRGDELPHEPRPHQEETKENGQRYQQKPVSSEAEIITQEEIKRHRHKSPPRGIWNYYALGERLAHMWILMPPELKQKLILPRVDRPAVVQSNNANGTNKT